MSLHIIRADANTLPLPDNSVDLVVTSPPYFGLRSYTDGGRHYGGQIGAEATPQEFVAALLFVTRECLRVLKPSGSLWVNLGDKYAGSNGQQGGPNSTLGGGAANGRARAEKLAARRGCGFTAGGAPAKSLIGLPWRYALACIDQLGLILRAEVIWSKPNGLPESVTDRVRRSHEQWFHFTLQPRYYSAVDEIREPHQPPTSGRNPVGARGDHYRIGSDGLMTNGLGSHPTGVDGHLGFNPLGKLPGSVWTVPTEPLRVPPELGVDHFAAFPSEWPRRIILGWSPRDGVVLDPFGGTGTTAHVADALGRTGITVDLSADYCRLAAHPALADKRRAKMQRRKATPKKKAQPPGHEQMALDA